MPVQDEEALVASTSGDDSNDSWQHLKEHLERTLAQTELLHEQLHRSWIRCYTAAIRGAGAAVCLRGGLHLVTSLLYALKKKRGNKREISLSEALTDTARWTWFLSTLGLSFVAIDEGLAIFLGKNRTAKWRALVAGAIAGQTLLLTGSKTRHYSLATYVLLRGLTLLIRAGNKPLPPDAAPSKALLRALLAPTRMQHGDTVLMCLSSAQIVYSFIMMPDSLPTSYIRFINKQANKELYVWKAVRELALQNWRKARPAPLRTLHGTAWQQCTARTPCEFWHPGHSCHGHTVAIMPHSYVRALGVYVPVYLLPALLVHRQRLLSQPATILPKLALGVARSAAFLTSFIALAFGGACVGFNVTGSCTGPIIAASTWPGGLAVLLEKRSRRMELALYCASRALESFSRCLLEWGVVPAALVPERLDVLLFSLGAAAIMHCYSDGCGAHRDVFKSKYLNVLDFVFGGSGVREGRIQHLPSNRDLIASVSRSLRSFSGHRLASLDRSSPNGPSSRSYSGPQGAARAHSPGERRSHSYSHQGAHGPHMGHAVSMSDGLMSAGRRSSREQGDVGSSGSGGVLGWGAHHLAGTASTPTFSRFHRPFSRLDDVGEVSESSDADASLHGGMAGSFSSLAAAAAAADAAGLQPSSSLTLTSPFLLATSAATHSGSGQGGQGEQGPRHGGQGLLGSLLGAAPIPSHSSPQHYAHGGANSPAFGMFGSVHQLEGSHSALDQVGAVTAEAAAAAAVSPVTAAADLAELTEHAVHGGRPEWGGSARAGLQRAGSSALRRIMTDPGISLALLAQLGGGNGGEERVHGGHKHSGSQGTGATYSYDDHHQYPADRMVHGAHGSMDQLLGSTSSVPISMFPAAQGASSSGRDIPQHGSTAWRTARAITIPAGGGSAAALGAGAAASAPAFRSQGLAAELAAEAAERTRHSRHSSQGSSSLSLSLSPPNPGLPPSSRSSSGIRLSETGSRSGSRLQISSNGGLSYQGSLTTATAAAAVAAAGHAPTSPIQGLPPGMQLPGLQAPSPARSAPGSARSLPASPPFPSAAGPASAPSSARHVPSSKPEIPRPPSLVSMISRQSSPMQFAASPPNRPPPTINVVHAGRGTVSYAQAAAGVAGARPAAAPAGAGAGASPRSPAAASAAPAAGALSAAMASQAQAPARRPVSPSGSAAAAVVEAAVAAVTASLMGASAGAEQDHTSTDDDSAHGPPSGLADPSFHDWEAHIAAQQRQRAGAAAAAAASPKGYSKGPSFRFDGESDK